MNARRSTPILSILLCACVAAVGLLVGSGAAASAAVTHEYLSHITGVPAGAGVPLPGPFKELSYMSIDGGKLYVAEKLPGGATAGSTQRIDVFNSATGAFASQFPEQPSLEYPYGLAAGHSTGEEQVYVRGSYEGTRAVNVFSGEGQLIGHWNGSDTPSGSFGEVRSVAIDSSASPTDWAAGHVYTADLSERVVNVFKPLAGGGEEYVTQFQPEAPFETPVIVAVEPSGDLLVVAEGESVDEVLDVYEPTVFGKYTLIRQLTGSPGGAFQKIESLATDGGDGEIYVGSGPAVYQFNEAGQYLGRLAGTPKGPFQDVRSLAVDPAAPHDVYVGDRREREPPVIDVFGPNLVIPDVTSTPASEVRAAGEGTIDATLNGVLNTDGAGEASCRFAWGITRELGQTATCEPEKIATGEAPVHATLHGAGVLAPDTTYYYRLQATNENGTNPGEPQEDQEFTTPGPGLRGEAVSAVRAESVTFDARISPHGRPTSYYFQYGPSSSYGTNVPALGAATPHGPSIGAGESVIEVSQHLQGLTPASAYHYRVVTVTELAPGQLESFYGPDRTFVTQRIGTPPSLPDGRRWEMVSPPQKAGAMLGWIYTGAVQASADGSAFTDWTSYEPTEDRAEGAYGFVVSEMFGRGADGWVSKTIVPRHAGATSVPVGAGGEYRAFSEDLSKGVLQPFGTFTPLAPQASESTPYLRSDFTNGDPGEPCAANCYQPLVNSANVPAGVRFGGETGGKCTSLFCGPSFIGGTPDLRHLVLGSSADLSTTSLEGNTGLYEWSEGHLQLVNVLPPGETNGVGGAVGGDARLGGGETDTRHAISNDGSRVIWMGSLEGGAHPHLYLRDTVNGTTIRLDTFEEGVEKGPEYNYILEYLTASEDGTRIFFRDGERLTADATAEEQAPDVYEYDLNAPQGRRVTDLSVATRPQEPADVTQVLGASGDGSYVYFAAPAVLAPGATPGSCGATSSSSESPCNLYLRHGGKTTFIAALSQDDHSDWAGLGGLTARVSPDGNWLAFMSNRSLTGYDTTDAISKQPDEEVYLYEAAHDKLICASCDPTGARPVGAEFGSEIALVAASGVFSKGLWVAANLPPWTAFSSAASYQSRYLSNSGRLFFDSHDALVPQDVNGTQDVYEYEPAAVGDCESSNITYSERLGGCVALVSSGTSAEESTFLDASETGGDVFFLTSARLVPADFDDQNDVYDARECGAASSCSALAAAAPPPCDTGESCKPGQAAQPTLFGAPPSETFSGTGNHKPSSGAPRARSLTRKQKLARALSVCRHKYKRKRRLACERRAGHLYGGGKRYGKASASIRALSRRAGLRKELGI